MAKIWMRQAVLRALDDAMSDDPTVILMGEDVAAAGGPFKVTEGLLAKHGPERVIDTPISEMGFMGAAVGAAVCGLKPVVEIMFIEFLGVALDQLTTQAATMRYLSRGKLTTPLVVRASAGAGQGFGCQHSQMLDHWMRGTPGLKLVVTSNARTTYGLLRSAIEDPDPVVVLEPRILYSEREEYEFDPAYRIPLGKAEIVRAGQGRDARHLRRHDPRRAGGRGQQRRQHRSHRPADAVAVGPQDRARIGRAHRPAGDARRGDRQRRLGRGRRLRRSRRRRSAQLKAPPHRITLPDAPVPYNGALGGPLSAQCGLCGRAGRRAGLDQQSAGAVVEERSMTLSNSNSPLARREALQNRVEQLRRMVEIRSVENRIQKLFAEGPCARQHASGQRPGGGRGRRRALDRSRRRA